MASSSVVYVFVAAMARSGPARRSMVVSAAAASGEAGSLVMAMVGAPCARPAAMTPTTSGEAPDCEMPMTSERSSRGRAPYSEMTDGVPSPTDSPCRMPSTYWA